ncbi:MAG: glycogen/starch synthase [Candidatus Woesearchaeota archaeon]
MNANADMLFEASWEITNKCGGIYTVISSKAKIMQSFYKKYISIGPLFDKLPLDFTKEETPEEFQDIFSELKSQGIKCVYGTWNILGAPKTILIDGRILYHDLNNIKTTLWNNFQVDTLNCANDFNEPLIWSWAVGIFLDKVAKKFNDKKIVGHFHEWLSGFALLYLRLNKSNVKTVFTTHATMLGRSISQSGEALRRILDLINPIDKARELRIIDKHSTEHACANNADVFTTVSDITANECNKFFNRLPDILPNGLLIEDFPNFERASYNHINLKRRLKEKIKAYFFPYYTFDVENSLLFYFGGRYEFITKGLNVLPKALGKLNNYLKLSNSNQNIVMLFLVAANSQGPKKEVLENENNYDDIKQFMDTITESVENKIVYEILSEKEPSNLLDKEELIALKMHYYKMKKDGLPPLCSHNLNYDEINDPLLNELKANGLLNRSEDQVKIIMVPYYLDGSDSFLDMEYYDIVNASHLGIFPSLYEPWGYTPLESIAFGVPAITSEEAGFGKFLKDKLPSTYQGVFLYNWQNNVFDASDRIFELMRNYISFNRHARVACKMNAHKLSYHADWKNLITYYIQAHNKALESNK